MTTADQEASIKKAIEQGPITEAYQADPQQVVHELHRLRATEVTSFLQYKQHAYMAVSMLPPGLKDDFEAHAALELQHADRLAARPAARRRPHLQPRGDRRQGRRGGRAPRTGPHADGHGHREPALRAAPSGGVYRPDPRAWRPGSHHPAPVGGHPGRHGAARERAGGLPRAPG